MPFYLTTKGIILKKRHYKDNQILLTIFSADRGKIIVWGYGVKKITSRRLSHLETGNLIRFSYIDKNNKFSLKETELIYGYSKIKKSLDKLNHLFLVLFVLDKILAENQPEIDIFDKTLEYIKKLNNKVLSQKLLNNYLSYLLVKAGFVTQKHVLSLDFKPQTEIEKILEVKIKSITTN